MFVEKLNTIDKNLVLNSVPKIVEDNLYYFRREKENYVSFAAKNGKTQEMLMNGTAWEILQMCNGERTISELIGMFTERYSYLKQNGNFVRDVVTTLSIFDRLWLLSWGKEGSPFMINRQIILSEDYTLTWANESQIRELTEAYVKFAGDTGYANHNCPVNKFKGLSDYQKETTLRSKLFYYKEDFFVLKNKDGQIKGIASVSNNYPDSSNLEVTTMIVPETFLKEVITGVQKLLVENYIFDLNKLRIKSISDELDESRKQVYLDCGFAQTAVLKDEYGKGVDLEIFDYIFERNDVNE